MSEPIYISEQPIYTDDVHGSADGIIIVVYKWDLATAAWAVWDLTGATAIELRCLKPDGTKIDYSGATLTAEGYIKHRKLAGEFNVAGDWYIRPAFTLSGSSLTGTPTKVTIYQSYNAS